MDENFKISQEKASEFLKRLKIIRQETIENLSIDDYKHYKDFTRKLTFFKLLGYCFAPFFPNIFSAIGFGVSRVGNWITMHHVSHKGYDRVPGYPEKLKSKNFAQKTRRYIDWIDLMLPEAWAYEHNILHHSYTGEGQDPDIPENKMKEYIDYLSSLTNNVINFNGKYIKSILFITSMINWRWIYYAPKTLEVLHFKNEKKDPPSKYEVFLDKNLWLKCYLPYFTWIFILIPLCYFPLGQNAILNVFLNSLLGEIIANIYSFIIIVTNHTGEDIYKYTNKTNSNQEKIFRQILGSVNYKTGGNWNDFFHMYLNYQIEHHIWPDLPMSAYKRIQPKIKLLCKEFNIPYVQESVFSRLKKTYLTMIGKTRMKTTEKLVV